MNILTDVIALLATPAAAAAAGRLSGGRGSRRRAPSASTGDAPRSAREWLHVLPRALRTPRGMVGAGDSR